MICKKCGAEIPAQSKFCPFCGEKAAQAEAPKICGGCGLQLAPSDKFCPVCGTKAGESSGSTSVFAGVQDAPADMPSVGTPSASQGSAAVQMNDSFSSLVGSMGTRGGEQSSGGVDLSKNRPSDSIPQPSYNVPRPSDSARPSDGVTSFAVPAQAQTPERGAPENQFNGVSFAVPDQTQTLGAEFGMTSAAAVSAAPIKKSKAWIWFVAGGVIIAVLAALTILFLTNRGTVMNMFMGDSGYARMIEANGVEMLSGAADDPALISQVKTLSAAAAAEMASEAAINEALENIDGGYGAYTAMNHSPYSGYGTAQVIPAIYDAFMQTYGTNGVTVTAKAELSLTSTAMELIFGSDDLDDINEALEFINSTAFTVKARAAEDRFAADIVISDNSGFYADARGIVYSDGTTAVMFPFGSDKCVKLTVEQGEYVAVETPELELDEKEIARLVNAVVELYLDCYENSGITIENDAKLAVNGASASGKLITAVINGEQLKGFITDSIELIATDDYLISALADYFSECGVSVTKEEIAQEIRDSFTAENYPDTVLTIKTVVDGNGNVLAKSYGVKQRSAAQDDSDEFCIAYLYSADLFELEMTFDGERLFGADVRKSSRTAGKADIRFYDEGEYLFGITVDYTDAKTARFAGQDILTGTYTLSLSAPADFTENNTLVSGSVDSLLYSAKFIFSSAVEGNTLKESVNIAVPQYGTAGLSIDVTCENADTPAIPADAIDITGLMDGEVSGEELSGDTDRLISMISGVKAAIDGQKNTGSPYVEMFSELCDEAISALEDAKSPVAYYGDIEALRERVSDDIDELGSIYDTYGEAMDSALESELRELQTELFDITYGTLYSDRIKQTELDSCAAKVDAIEQRISKFKDKAVEMYQDSFGLSFDYMTYEDLELLLQVMEIELDYFGSVLSGSDIDKSLSDAYKKANYEYIQARSAYQSMTIEIERSNTFSISSLRKLRKATETAYDALKKLENSAGITDSWEF